MLNSLRVLRASNGWSQGDLASRLGVSRQTVHAIEADKCDPSLPLAFAIAKLFERTIKVDREERPDVDSIYMQAVQLMTSHGGWPMSVFLTPDAQPFYAGTYFPPTDRHGMPGFGRVLAQVAEAYRSRREEVQEASQEV